MTSGQFGLMSAILIDVPDRWTDGRMDRQMDEKPTNGQVYLYFAVWSSIHRGEFR